MTMTDPSLRDQAYQFFEQEALDLLQALEDGLLSLRTEFDVPHVHQLMRAAHSIKGGAGSVELPGIQRIAHRLEDIFHALYHWQDPIDAGLEAALLQSYDCLRLPLLEQLQTGHYDEQAALANAEPVFAYLEKLLERQMMESFELPTSTELGIDIVYEVFAGDVTREIQRLEKILRSGEPENLIASEIRASAEVLTGIGDLLELPGFRAISQTTLQALEGHPHMALAIGQAAVACLQAAQKQILAGDRTQGGSPSLNLLRWVDPSTTSVPSLADEVVSSNAVNGSLAAVSDLHGNDLLWISNPETAGWSDQLASNAGTFLENLFGSVELDANLTIDSPLTIDSATTDASANLLEDIFGLNLDLEATTASLELLPPVTNPAVDAETRSDEARSDIASPLMPPIGLPTIPPGLIFPEQALQEKDKPSGEQRAVTPKSPKSTTPYRGGESIRVDFSRLERLNNLVGELVTQENGALLHSQQLQEKLKRLQQSLKNFEQLSKHLQDWMDQSFKLEVSHQFSQLQTRPESTSHSHHLSALADFDPLQMDSYSHLYTMVQEIREEIAQMAEGIGDVTLITQQTQQIQRRKQQTLKQVRNDLLWARMIPIGDILQRFPRMVQDLSAKHGKQVNLRQVGNTTPVDKAILERLYDPLVHLIRNAFDHGTETPAERLASGKSQEATIEIRAYHRGSETIIEIRDDGRGIDPEKVRAAVIDRGILSVAAAETLKDTDLYRYLFEPSFSTMTVVSELSGRGMGLSTVQEQVKSLKGTITITSEMGQGTTFTIRLPLTLTIAKLLVFRVEEIYMAIPVDTLMAIVAFGSEDISTIQGHPFYRYQKQLVPLYPASIFERHYPLPKQVIDKGNQMLMPRGKTSTLLIIANGQDLMGLEVDQISNEQELVIKPFGRSANPPNYLYGCAILGSGLLVPVVDGSILIANWKASAASPPLQRSAAPAATVLANQHQSTILVVDDSLTIRQSVTFTLQKTGYQVVQASDGQEALERLRQDSSIKAVISDVEMPNMNGFEFLSACRKLYPAATLPVMMLTSRSSDKHRGIAKLLGANHYLTKPYLEQDLIKSLQTCLEAVEC